MLDESDGAYTITFTLSGAGLTELLSCATVEGRTPEMQAKILVLKALGKYADYTPPKKPVTVARSVAKKSVPPSRPSTAMGGLA